MVQTRKQLKAAGLTPVPAMGSKAAKAIAKTPAPGATKKATPRAKSKTSALQKRTTPELSSTDSSADVPLAQQRKATTTAANFKKSVHIAVTPSATRANACPPKPAASKKRKTVELENSGSETEEPVPAPPAKMQRTASTRAGIFASTPFVSKRAAASKKRKMIDSDESEVETFKAAPLAKQPIGTKKAVRTKKAVTAKIAAPAKKAPRSRAGPSAKKPKMQSQSSSNGHTSDELHTPTQTSTSGARAKPEAKKRQFKEPSSSDDEGSSSSSGSSSSANSKNYVSDSSTDWSKYESEFEDNEPNAPASQPAQTNGQASQGGDSGHDGEDESGQESGDGSDEDAPPDWPDDNDSSYDVSPPNSNPGGRRGRESTDSVHDLVHTRNVMQITDLIRMIGQQLQRDFDYAALFNLRQVNKQCWITAERSFFRSFHHFTIVLAPEFVTWAVKLLSNQAICDRIKLVSFDAPPRGYGYDIRRPQDLRSGLYRVLRNLNNVETVEFARLQKLHPRTPILSSRDKLWRKESDLDFYYKVVLEVVGQWSAPIERLTNQREEDDTRVWEHDEANTLPWGHMPLDCFTNHAQTPLATIWSTRYHALETAELDVDYRTNQMTSEAEAFLLCGLRNARDLRLDHNREDEVKLHNFVSDLGTSFRLNSPHLRNLMFLTVYGPLVTQYNFPYLLSRLGPRLVGVDLRQANLTYADVKWPFIAGMQRFLKHWIGRKGQFPNLQDFKLEVLWKEKHRFDERPLNRLVWEMRDRRDVNRPHQPWKAFWMRVKWELEQLNDRINDGDVSSEEVSSNHAEPLLPSENESSE